MSDYLLDPFDRDHGTKLATSAWVIAALVGLILVAMVLDIFRAAGATFVRVGRPAALGEIGAGAAR